MASTRKYEITTITKQHYGHTLFRIRALRSFNDVKEGSTGGWIEKESNLDQDGSCWIYDDAKVYDDARITGSAIINK